MSKPSQDNSDLLDLLGVLRRRKGLICFGVLLGAIGAVMYYALTPKVYRAKMEVLVGQKSGEMVKGASADASQEGVHTDDDVLSTHIQLMTSRRIVKSAIEKHNLDQLDSVYDTVAKGGSAVKHITDHLVVSKGGDGVARDAHTLRATYDDSSPEDCATILRAVFDEYDSYLKEQFAGTSSQAIELLGRLANDTSSDVLKAEEQLAGMLKDSSLMWDGERTKNIHKIRLESIESELLGLTQQEAETSSRLAVITQFIQKSDPNSVTDFDRLALLSEKEVARIKILFDVTRGDTTSEAFQAQQPIRQENARVEYDEYLRLIMKEKKLVEDFGDGHPSIESVREQITTMRTFIDQNAAKLRAGSVAERMTPDQMLTTYVGLLENDMAGVKRQREVLLERSSQELARAKELESDEMKVESLRLDLARKQNAYETMQKTLGELNFVRDYAGFSTDVIGDAETQEKPSWPRPLIVIALGLFSGGIFGFGMALLADMLDTTFVDPDDLQETLGAPVIAHVPRFKALSRKRKEATLPVDSSVRVFHEPKSPEAEVYRVVRTGLLMDARKHGQQVIQVTSPLPGDGKSTTSVNVAMAFAQTGKKTLLIDADLRKPRVERLLRLEGETGLAHALIGEHEPNDVVQSTIHESLFAVTAGCMPPNPCELLQSEKMSELLELWKQQFDFIIVDTPPVLAVSDALVVSEVVDNLLMAVRITKNGRRAALRAVEILEQAEAKVGGIVVNGYKSNDRNYGYAGYYNADVYGYGEGESHKGYYSKKGASLQSA